MELTREESKRILRRIELEAYSALVTALRAQGELDRQKKKLLRDLAEQLSISTERHRAEIRRAISDDRLSMIAECVCGSDASVEWESEGRRVVPLMPRLVPQTAFTGCATAAANHAANVNSTIPSTLKGHTKGDDDEDYRSRKRQRPSSPVPVQKVIVSSASKTTPSTTTVRSNTTMTSKDSSRLIKTPSLSVKQETRTQHPSIKLTSSAGGSSKTNISGGSKSSSVSVAPSKYVAPLPASCLQAHASVVSGNKNRMNVNVVKTKPVKPKVKTLTTSVKMKSSGTSVASSVVQTVAQSLLSIAKTCTKDNELSSKTINKTVQVSRSTSTITVAPRSSISLTTFKSNVQTSPNTQSGQSSVRNVEGISRQNTTQLGKAVSVSRRPLPTILPKTLPLKALTTVSSPGRKLTSILPAPAKTTTSSLPNPLIVPVVVTTSSTPVPIALSPRPPQSCHTSITSSVVNKVTTVSMATGQRDNQGTSLVSSPILCGKSPANSQDSSPISSKSLDSIHQRETLSPVNEILTLVTSPSSVPFVPSSPVKSLPNPTLTSGEISLECDENLLEDLIKDDDITVKNLPSISTNNSKDNNELNLDRVKQDLKNDVTNRGNTLQKQKTNNETEQTSKDVLTKTDETVSTPIDLSPLVSELISSSSFDVDKKEFENLNSSNLLQSNTASVAGGNSSELFVGKFPVIDLGFNVSETVKSETDDVSSSKEEEKIIVDKINVDVQQETGSQKGNSDSLTNENKKQEIVERENPVNLQTENASVDKSVESNSKDVNLSEGVKDVFCLDDSAKSDEEWSSGNKIGNRSAKNDHFAEPPDKEKLQKCSKHEEKNLSNLQKNDEKLDSTTSSNISIVNTTDTKISQDSINERCSGEDKSSENIKTAVEKTQSAFSDSDLRIEDKNIEDNKTERAETDEMVTSNIKEKSHDALDKDPLTSNTTTQKQESCEMPETQVIQESKDDDRKCENTDEQLSGSELGSPEGNLVRTSNRKRKAPPPRDLSVHPPGWVRSALQLLQKISRFRGSSRSKNARSAASWFLKPVATSEAPGYYKVIKNPMDFGTIKTKLETSEYNTPADFHRDMLLVKSNCCKYNPPGHIVRKDCDEVFQFYEAEYEKFLEKLDKIYLSSPKKQKPSPT